MAEVEIEYSLPHGYRRRAEDIRDRIEEDVPDAVDDVTFVEGDRMDFKIRVDGELVYDKKKRGYDEDRIMQHLTKVLGVEPEAEA